jgi:hypothetical protein
MPDGTVEVQPELPLFAACRAAHDMHRVAVVDLPDDQGSRQLFDEPAEVVAVPVEDPPHLPPVAPPALTRLDIDARNG